MKEYTLAVLIKNRIAEIIDSRSDIPDDAFLWDHIRVLLKKVVDSGKFYTMTYLVRLSIVEQTAYAICKEAGLHNDEFIWGPHGYVAVFDRGDIMTLKLNHPQALVLTFGNPSE